MMKKKMKNDQKNKNYVLVAHSSELNTHLKRYVISIEKYSFLCQQIGVFTKPHHNHPQNGINIPQCR